MGLGLGVGMGPALGLGRHEHRVSGHGEAGAQHILGDGTLHLVGVRRQAQG